MSEVPDPHAFLKACILVFAIYLVITLVMFWPVSSDPSHTIVNAAFRNSDIFGGDVFDGLWNLWWAGHAVLTPHSNLYFTNMLFYPVGSDLATHTLAPLEGILTLPLQPLGLVFRYNFVFISSFALSGLFMFMLAYFFVNDKYAPFLAGLIYAFSPINIAQNYAHLTWASSAFVPLFILFLLLTLEKRQIKYMVVAALALLFIMFFGDLEIGIIATFFAVLLLLYLAITKNARFRISVRSVTCVFAIYLLVLLFGAPFFAPIFRSIIYSNAISRSAANSNLFETIQFSNNMLSFLLPSYYNGAFNHFSNLYYNDIFSPDLNEKVAYVGYSVLVLVLLAIFYSRKTKKYKEVKLWLFGAISFGLISLGPLIQVSRYVLPIPGPYLIYYYIPLFNIVAEPGRFDLIAAMCIAVLAAIGFHELSSRVSKKYKGVLNTSFMLAIIFAVLILVEYNGMPSRTMAAQLFMKPQVPPSYGIIAQKQGNYSVLILPDLRDNATNYLYPGMAMYFQSVFQKPIFGGYVSRVTIPEEFSPYVLPLSLQSMALQDNYSNVSQAYPIRENYTYADMFLAKIYSISFVAVIRGAYSFEEYKTLDGHISTAFGQPVYSDNTTSLYSTTAIANYTFKYPVAYVEGPWYLVNGTWWANGTSSVTIYSERLSSVEISMDFVGYGSHAYECLNGVPINEVTLGRSTQHSSMNLTINAGINKLTLSADSSCSEKDNVVWGTRGIGFD